VIYWWSAALGGAGVIANAQPRVILVSKDFTATVGSFHGTEAIEPLYMRLTEAGVLTCCTDSEKKEKSSMASRFLG
jgi:hypothetical protein